MSCSEHFQVWHNFDYSSMILIVPSPHAWYWIETNFCSIPSALPSSLQLDASAAAVEALALGTKTNQSL